MSVCGFSLGRQDNWLITQHISRVIDGTETRLRQVSVMVEFQLQLVNCHAVCQRTFILNVWETSSADRNAARNTANYRAFSTVAPDRSDDVFNRTIELNFMTEEDGFYLGIRDETSCFALSRVIVFYHVCPDDVSDLVVRPETIAPRIHREGLLEKVTTKCVPEAIPENSEVVLNCAQGGVWSAIAGSGCQCNPGLIKAGDGKSCKGKIIPVSSQHYTSLFPY